MFSHEILISPNGLANPNPESPPSSKLLQVLKQAAVSKSGLANQEEVGRGGDNFVNPVKDRGKTVELDLTDQLVSRKC